MRLLRGRPSQHLATEEHLLGRRMRNRSTILSAGRLVPHHRDTRGMTWRDKLHRWSRFVLPASVPDGSKPKHLKLASRVDLSCPPDSSSGQAAQDTLTATFGHILHHKPIPKADKTTTKRSAAARRRILSPVVPHPAAFTDLPATDLTKQLSIVLNFVPAATGTPAASAPEVKLTLPIVEDADYERASISPASTLHATRPVLAKDILVPDEAVDVRVVRQAETPLDLDGQDGLRAFLDASQLVLSQGLLKTPSATTLVLPGGDAPVPYLFAGLTVHDTVDLAWEDGCTLRFESVEADRHEGTYQQLSVRSGASSTEEAFLALLERAVEGKIWSWTKGVDQVREIPEEEEELYEEEEDVYDDQAEEVEAMAEQESSLDAVCHDALAAGYKLSDSIEDHLEQMLLTELEADEDFSRALEDVSVEVDAPHASLDAACHESLAAGHRLAGRIEDQLDQMLQRELEAVNEQMEDPEHDKQPSEKTAQ